METAQMMPRSLPVLRACVSGFRPPGGEFNPAGGWEHNYAVWLILPNALESSGRVEDTLVVFSSDHGEGMGMHQTVLKSFLYDEAARVPLMASWPGHVEEGRRDRVRLVSGLDVLPTLCDFAGIPAPPKMRGRSLRPLLEGRNVEWREFVVSESATTGRMLRTAGHKLIRYEGDETSQLFDMKADTGETKNLALDSRHGALLRDLQRELAAWEGRLEPAG